MPPDEPRFRRPTLSVPPRPPSNDERLAVVERDQHHFTEWLGRVDERITSVSTQVKAIGDNVLLLADRAAEAAKSRDRWKNWFLGIASGVAVLLIAFLATIAWRVQGGKVASP